MTARGIETVEITGERTFEDTVGRLLASFERAGLTVFARIDHHAAAAAAGLTMPPATVLIYGNPRGGTPVMLASPGLAPDLPLRVLVREDDAGRVIVAFHPALPMIRAAGLQEDLAAPLIKAQKLIETAVQG